MYFERLHFERKALRVVDARVGDEVFSDAKVAWDAITGESRVWIFEELDGALQAWLGQPPTSDGWRLEGSDDGEGPRYRLEAVDGEDAPASWDQLTDAARARVLEHLGEVLAGVNGMLLIY